MEYRIIYHDVMPMMADVFSGAYARPTEFIVGADPLPNITGTMAEKRIKEKVGETMVPIAGRGVQPTAYAKQVAELRQHQDSDSAIILAGRTLIAFNADATNFATLDVSRTKQYSDGLQVAAMKMIKDSGVDITDQVAIRPFIKPLMDATGCSYNIAKQHIAKAIRRSRGLYVAGEWGGSREGAGRPKSD